MYSYGDSMEDIAKQLRMSLKTIRKIIRSYKNVRVGDLEIDAQVINRSKSHSKYSNENSIVNFIREYASSPTFDRTFTCKKLIKVLNSKFGPKQSFKKSTTYKLIHAAGLRRKKMNFNFYPKSSTLSSVNIRRPISGDYAKLCLLKKFSFMSMRLKSQISYIHLSFGFLGTKNRELKLNPRINTQQLLLLALVMAFKPSKLSMTPWIRLILRYFYSRLRMQLRLSTRERKFSSSTITPSCT